MFAKLDKLNCVKQEIAGLNAAGISCKGRLFVSDRAQVILDYHREVERACDGIMYNSGLLVIGV